MEFINQQVASEADNLKDFLRSMEYRVARNRDELEQAYGLVYRQYLKRGYTKVELSGLRLSFYNALPQTTTFIAISGKDVVATATLIADSPLLLPMDKIYHNELDVFRSSNIKLCEISMLSSDTELFSKGISLMLNSKKLFFIFSLFKVIYDYVKYTLKLNYICISVNPKHKLTYDFLLFKTLGKEKVYSNANNAPAVGMYVDAGSVEEECKVIQRRGVYDMFFLKTTSPDKFQNKHEFSESDFMYFFKDKTDLIKRLTDEELNYLKSCHPDWKLSELAR